MPNYLIKDIARFSEVLVQLDISDFIVADGLYTLNDLFLQIESNKAKDEILKKLTYHILYNQVNGRFINDESLDMKNLKEVKLNSILRDTNASRIKESLSNLNPKWRLPLTILSSTSFFLLLTSFTICAVVLFYSLKIHPEIFIITMSLFSISLLLFFAILPNVLLILLFPNIFGRKNFIDIKSFNDLISEMQKLNYQYYVEENYEKLKRELFSLYGPF